MFTRKRKP